MYRKKNLFSLLFLAVFATIFIFGCAYKSIEHGTEISEEQVSKIKNGQTTKEDILVEFGDPNKTMNNDKAYFYSWTRGSKGHFFGFGSGNAYTHSLVIIFDNNDFVKSSKITRGTTEAATNVGD